MAFYSRYSIPGEADVASIVVGSFGEGEKRDFMYFLGSTVPD